MLTRFSKTPVQRWVTLLLVAAALLLSACGAPRELDEQDIAELEQRVRDRWQTKIERDFGATWEFATPSYRETFPKNLYARKFSYAVDWQLTGVELLDYDAHAAVASVAVGVMSKPTKQTSAASAAIGAIPRTIREKWIFIDGQWWYSTDY